MIFKKVEIKRIVFSEEDSHERIGSFKDFTGYKNETNDFPVPICTKSPQINGHVKFFHSNNKHINLFSSW